MLYGKRVGDIKLEKIRFYLPLNLVQKEMNRNFSIYKLYNLYKVSLPLYPIYASRHAMLNQKESRTYNCVCLHYIC